MTKETKKRMVRGDYVGTTQISGIEQGQGTYDVFVEKGHFSLAYQGKFIRHIKMSVLKAKGIFSDAKKIYGPGGYIGCPKRA